MTTAWTLGHHVCPSQHFSLGNQDCRVGEPVSWAPRPLECPPQTCQWADLSPGHGGTTATLGTPQLGSPRPCFPEGQGHPLAEVLRPPALPPVGLRLCAPVPIFPATPPLLAQGCSSPAPAQGFLLHRGPLALGEGALGCAGCPLLSCTSPFHHRLGEEQGFSSKIWYAHPSCVGLDCALVPVHTVPPPPSLKPTWGGFGEVSPMHLHPGSCGGPGWIVSPLAPWPVTGSWSHLPCAPMGVPDGGCGGVTLWGGMGR